MFLKPERKRLTCEKSLEKGTLIFSGNRWGKKGLLEHLIDSEKVV